MSTAQKLMLLILHRFLVSKNLFFAANDVLQYLILNQIPKSPLYLTIIRIHLLSLFNCQLVNQNFPNR